MMSAGKKRLADPSFAIDSSDSPLESKRVMAAPNFDVHRAEAPKLDAQRAQSCHLHVRALNTQYASWVKSQLENHPDELWQEGAQDYIKHASHILEKFSDVVDWIKAHAVKIEGYSAAVIQSRDSQTKPVNKVESSMFMSRSEPNSFSTPAVPVSSTPNLFGLTQTSDSKNPSLLLNKFSGPQATVRNVETTEDGDDEDEAEKPSSPSLKRTEEKGIVIVHEIKCKLYMQPENSTEKGWKDFGVGQLSIRLKEGAMKGTRESKPTVLVRNDVGKILLNALIYSGIKTTIQKNTITAIFHTGGEGGGSKARTFLLKTKTAEETADLASAMKEYAPAS